MSPSTRPFVCPPFACLPRPFAATPLPPLLFCHAAANLLLLIIFTIKRTGIRRVYSSQHGEGGQVVVRGGWWAVCAYCRDEMAAASATATACPRTFARSALVINAH